MHRSRALAAALIAVLPVSACSGGGPSDRADPPTEAPGPEATSGLPSAAPGLRPAVTAAGRGIPAPVTGLGRAFATSDGSTSVLVTADTLVGYDARTHGELWTTSVPDSVCGASVIDDGRIAVLTDPRGDLSECGSVAVVEVEDGAVAWTRTLGDASAIFHPGVTLGGGTVHAGGECGEVLRFDAATGDPRSTLAPADRACGHTSVFGDSVVGVVDDPAGDGPARLAVLDTTTGELLFRRRNRTGTEPVGVVSEDPLVLDVTELGGSRRELLRYDDRGRLLGSLGRGVTPDDGFAVLARSGDVLVATLDGGVGARAYDVTTGDELWREESTRRVVGASDDGLIWVQEVEVADDEGRPVVESQVVRTDLREPGPGDVLGSVEVAGAGLVVVGDDLVRQGSGTAAVFPLPSDPVGGAPAPDPASGATRR